MTPHKATKHAATEILEYRYRNIAAELRKLAAENYSLGMRLAETEGDLRAALALINRLKAQRPG